MGGLTVLIEQVVSLLLPSSEGIRDAYFIRPPRSRALSGLVVIFGEVVPVGGILRALALKLRFGAERRGGAELVRRWLCPNGPLLRRLDR